MIARAALPVTRVGHRRVHEAESWSDDPLLTEPINIATREARSSGDRSEGSARRLEARRPPLELRTSPELQRWEVVVKSRSVGRDPSRAKSHDHRSITAPS